VISVPHQADLAALRQLNIDGFFAAWRTMLGWKYREM
jgi:hypothetical protein